VPRGNARWTSASKPKSAFAWAPRKQLERKALAFFPALLFKHREGGLRRRDGVVGSAPQRRTHATRGVEARARLMFPGFPVVASSGSHFFAPGPGNARR